MDNPTASQSEAVTAVSVLPLALTPLEKFLFWDDQPGQPCTAFFELEFATRIEPRILEIAIAKVFDKHPLLRALVAGNKHDLSWVACQEPFRLHDLANRPPIRQGRIAPIDLRQEAGCRCWYEATSDGCRLIIQLHHCVCDGVAFRGVLIDVLHTYALATSSDLEAVEKRDMLYDRFRYEELKHRFEFPHLAAAKHQLTTWQRTKNAYYFHFQTPKALLTTKGVAVNKCQDPFEQSGRGANRSHQRAETILPLNAQPCVQCDSQPDSSPLRTLTLSRELSGAIVERCTAQSLSINQLSLAILFRTCASWNRRLGDKRDESRLRILMPYDLRGRVDLRMPATNRLAFSFLGRTYRQCDDFEELLASLKVELNAIRDTHLFLDLLNALKLASRFPRFMRWVIGRSHSMATVVFTYAGDVSRGMSKLFPEVEGGRRIGDSRLRSIMAAPPIRRNTNISLALGIYLGQINVAAAWNRAALTATDCENFLELFRSGWQQWHDGKI